MGLKSSERLQICLSEYQSTGRGRLGRRWHSPFARNVYLSVRTSLPLTIDALSGLSLAVGCSIADSLAQLGATQIGLKWPNDLRVQNRKVGGILIEIAGQSPIGADLIIGLGLNWDMPAADNVDQPWANLRPLLQDGLSRNQLVVALVHALNRCLQLFSSQGFSGFVECWNQYDDFIDKSVLLSSGETKVYGRYLGVDHAGALRLETEKGIEYFIGGELSLRQAT
jgi:BirA family biotin operon repressor/biotin-[acetyl-CoA-carboxylase] ligase